MELQTGGCIDLVMAWDIKGNTALVTGGAKRIGRTIALALADAGVKVVIHYRSSAKEAEGAAEEIRKRGFDAWSVQADFAVEEDVRSLVRRVTEIAGPLHILINNASEFPEATFETVEREDLLRSMAIDAWAPFALARSFAEGKQARHIINMLDTRIVSNYDWQHFAYNAAKHTLGLFTRMMAVKFAPGIQVNAVAPGLILPPEGKDRAYLEELKDALPMKKIGAPEHVADAVLFLLRSEFITGQVIYVDGGRHLREVGCG